MQNKGVAVRYLDADPNKPWNDHTQVANIVNGDAADIPAMRCVFWIEPGQTASEKGVVDRVTGTVQNRGTLFAGITKEAIAPGEQGEVVTRGRVRALVDDPAIITYGCSLKLLAPTSDNLGMDQPPSDEFDSTALVVAMQDGSAGDTYIWVWVKPL